jgi:heme-degrading monooxygenase HmoA
MDEARGTKLVVMYTTVWRFTIRPEDAAAFEEQYGPDGPWGRLFRSARGYLGTELYRNTAAEGGYVTVDRWEDEASFRRFREEHAAEYEALDARMESLTLAEEHLGERR